MKKIFEFLMNVYTSYRYIIDIYILSMLTVIVIPFGFYSLLNIINPLIAIIVGIVSAILGFIVSSIFSVEHGI